MSGGYLRGGMAQLGPSGHQQHRERLWLSPHCLTGEAKLQPAQGGLWADDDD